MKNNARDLSVQQGFTVIEFLLVLAISAVLFGFATLNLVNVQRNTSLASTIELLTADLREQQLKAMVGETEGTGTPANYGIRFAPAEYTLFRNTYGTANFVTPLPGFVGLTTTLPNSQIIFEKGSGEVSGFSPSTNTITLTDKDTGDTTILTINKYGAITGVN